MACIGRCLDNIDIFKNERDFTIPLLAIPVGAVVGGVSLTVGVIAQAFFRAMCFPVIGYIVAAMPFAIGAVGIGASALCITLFAITILNSFVNG